jgi:hypothetical protein
MWSGATLGESSGAPSSSPAAGLLLRRWQRHSGATLGESTDDGCGHGLRLIWRKEGAGVVCLSRERGGGAIRGRQPRIFDCRGAAAMDGRLDLRSW